MLDASDREGIAQLAAALKAAPYEPGRMRVVMRSENENLTPRPEDIPVLLRLLPRDDRLANLLRLFLIGATVDEARATEALAPLAVERAIRMGVVTREDNGVRGAVRLYPASGFVFACDVDLESSPDLAADHVMGVSSSSIFLASLTIREPVRDVLDIGCGGGIQSVLAAKHAKRVVACDINPRALAFARFNAALNGVANVECRQGSFFDPVRGEKFDLVVSNPPFVVSPDNLLTFRDSGMRGDEVSRMVVREAAAHLADGGRAVVLVSWGVPRGASWDAPVREWTKDLGCDAWFLHQASATALGYAATWNEPLQRGSDPAAFEAALDRWTKAYAELGFDAIAYGAVILRKRAAATHWTRTDDLHGQREPASGEQIARLIAVEDWLASHDDAALRAARLNAVPQQRLDQTLRLRNGVFGVDGATLRLEEGFRFSVPIDAFTAELLARLDGSRTLEAATAEASARFAGDGIPAEQFLSEGTQIARELLKLGFVRLNA